MNMKINNDITEPYCSFEVSELLKEKGFDCECNTFRLEDGEFIVGRYPTNNNECGIILAPTHALAVEWLRINFNVWVSVELLSDGRFNGIATTIGDWCLRYLSKPYDVVYPAKEAALAYALKELV